MQNITRHNYCCEDGEIEKSALSLCGHFLLIRLKGPFHVLGFSDFDFIPVPFLLLVF
jgi:hypothetical protein